MTNFWKKAAAVLLSMILIIGALPSRGLVGLLAAAETLAGTCGADGDNLTWSLDTDSGVLTVSGTGDMADFDDEDNAAPWLEHTGSIRSVTVGSGVTSIGDYAFYYQGALTSVTIGEDVTRIGELAFALSGLESVFIPGAVEEIGENAFACMTVSEDGEEVTPTIQSITVDAGSAYFSAQDGVLYDKTGETLVQYPVGKPTSTFTVPTGVTTIGDGAFALSILLTGVTFSDTVTEIGVSAFEECFALESVTFGSGLERIDNYAFYGCAGLTSVTIPDSVTEIGTDAFHDCEGLETLTLGSGLKSIGESAFDGCTQLTSVAIPDSVTTIEKDAFSGCSSLSSLTLGSGIDFIPSGAFASTALTAVTIPDKVTQIGSNAFTGCASLADVTLGSGLVTIDAGAFYGCTALESIHIPSGVTMIESNAFGSCDNLAYICSDAATGAAKEYADAYGIEFRYCGSGEQPANTVSGTCGDAGDNVAWTLDLDTGDMTVSGTGAMADYDSTGDVPWAEYLDSILTVTVESGVTSVGDGTFANCGRLTDVTLGNDVTTIGSRAFADCRKLTGVSLPGSLTAIGKEAFVYCMQLTSVALPEGLVSVGEMAFTGTGLTDVVVPRSVQEIGERGFVGVVEDESGNPVPTLLRIDVDAENAFFASEDGVLYDKAKTVLLQYPCGKTDAKYTIPDSVTQIGAGALIYAMNLESVTIPDSVKAIGEEAFAYCVLLQEIIIPEGLSEIANSTFLECISLTAITLPDSVKSINAYAFAYCSSLTDVTFGSGLAAIGNKAFTDTALSSVILPDALTEIGSGAFAYCGKLESAHIPAGVTTIADDAFENCPNLQFICSDAADTAAKTFADKNSIEFRLCTGHTGGGEVTTVRGECGYKDDAVLWALNLGTGEMVISGSGAMADFASADSTPWAQYRNSIQSVTILSGVTSVGNYAFAGCVPLTNVALGEGLTSIGTSAFDGTALRQVFIPRTVQSIGSGALNCCTNFNGLAPTLQMISVDEDNEWFCAVDGVLYDKAQTTLICYPGANARTLFVIPDSVTGIADKAFRLSVNLMNVHIPASVTQIGAATFDSCTSLEYLCCDSDRCYAKEYAADNGFAFRLCDGHTGAARVAGDANGDGIVNLKDVVLMRRYLAEGWDVTIFAWCADVDADNEITLQDVVLVSRFLAGGWDVELV